MTRAPICPKVAPSETINGVYLQVARHPADPKTLAALEPRLGGGELSVKELVRQLALSEEFKSSFVKARAPEEAIAVVHERLLARPPSPKEAADLAVSARANGFDFIVNSIIDGPEYGELFGERAVPPVLWPDAPLKVMFGPVAVAGVAARVTPPTGATVHLLCASSSGLSVTRPRTTMLSGVTKESSPFGLVVSLGVSTS
jgi:hypothetical protein